MLFTTHQTGPVYFRLSHPACVIWDAPTSGSICKVRHQAHEGLMMGVYTQKGWFENVPAGLLWTKRAIEGKVALKECCQVSPLPAVMPTVLEV